MNKRTEPEYRKKEAVEVDLTEERFRRLREAYLEGRIKVNSQALAEKLFNFERPLSEALKAAETKQKKT